MPFDVDWSMLRNFLIAILALLNPVGKLPLWVKLTNDLDSGARRRIAFLVSGTGAGVLLVFLLGGKYILRAFSMDLTSFQAAGGVLVLVTAVDMVQGRATKLGEREEDGDSPYQIAKQRFRRTVVPLAVPMIAGPGSITMVMIYGTSATGVASYLTMVLALVAVLSIVLVVFLLSERLEKHVDETVFTVVTRIFGLILAGIAMQLLLEALGQAFPSWVSDSSPLTDDLR